MPTSCLHAKDTEAHRQRPLQMCQCICKCINHHPANVPIFIIFLKKMQKPIDVTFCTCVNHLCNHCMVPNFLFSPKEWCLREYLPVKDAAAHRHKPWEMCQLLPVVSICMLTVGENSQQIWVLLRKNGRYRTRQVVIILVRWI